MNRYNSPVFALFLAILCSGLALAQPPETIIIQGQLLDNNGTFIPLSHEGSLGAL